MIEDNTRCNESVLIVVIISNGITLSNIGSRDKVHASVS